MAYFNNCAVLAAKFPFANELNSMARQASAERAWSSISRFYENCKKGIPGKKGFPQFQKDCRGNACGDETPTLAGENLHEQVMS